MKNILKHLPILAIIAACGTANTTNTIQKDTTPTTAAMVGNDVDAHGCKGSAGYQWSQVKQSCIRLFEEGIRLNPQPDTASQSISAFVVFKSQDIQDIAELFLPNDSSQYLVQDKTNGAGKWTNTKYQLTQWKGMYTLETISPKAIIYQGAAVK
jgi:hypothetical protein